MEMAFAQHEARSMWIMEELSVGEIEWTLSRLTMYWSCATEYDD